jgi:hypothetical protein
VSLPRSTLKPLTALAVGSTTQSVLPSGERRASSGVPAGLTGVFWRRVSEPPGSIELLEIDPEALLTANRYFPSWLISTPAGRGLIVRER